MCLFSKILYFSLILTLSYKSAVFSDRHTSGNFDKKGLYISLFQKQKHNF